MFGSSKHIQDGVLLLLNNNWRKPWAVRPLRPVYLRGGDLVVQERFVSFPPLLPPPKLDPRSISAISALGLKKRCGSAAQPVWLARWCTSTLLEPFGLPLDNVCRRIRIAVTLRDMRWLGPALNGSLITGVVVIFVVVQHPRVFGIVDKFRVRQWYYSVIFGERLRPPGSIPLSQSSIDIIFPHLLGKRMVLRNRFIHRLLWGPGAKALARWMGH
ncbi:hypothetical protein DFP72DRAFT_859732 [Ephemerocybe angulata]|uniref:Uncharacterized protein n=1 Tax=Ephemerocybe angulata TaxID=980116 RepID=A0A8H6LW34_9AGAR|nr:hypothetical protein DFP72DRAFT_859732 [Tulosesus angulatus]